MLKTLRLIYSILRVVNIQTNHILQEMHLVLYCLSYVILFRAHVLGFPLILTHIIQTLHQQL